MVDRPILFSGPMVRALLNGSKTQTRRLATSKPTARIKVGDRLWVREAWQLHQRASDFCTIAYDASVNHFGWNDAHEQLPDSLAAGMQPKPFQEGWRPSIHMPRWASRITLTVTETRVMPLSWILEADAQAEGIEPVRINIGQTHWSDAQGGTFAYASHAYASLWNSLHKAPGTTWDDSPDVIAVTFKVARENIDARPAVTGAEAASLYVRNAAGSGDNARELAEVQS